MLVTRWYRCMSYCDDVFVINEGYIASVDYLVSRPNLSRLYERPYISCESELIAEHFINEDVVRQFPTGATAHTARSLIYALCDAKKAGGADWLHANKEKLELLGHIPEFGKARPVSQMHSIDIKNALKDYEVEVHEVSEYDEALRSEIRPFVDHVILCDVFNGSADILSQELVIYEGMGIYAECDLSSADAVLMIVLNDLDPAKKAEQLYYQANGRDAYLLEIVWGESVPGGQQARLLLYRVNPHPGEKPNTRSEKVIARIREALVPQGIELAEYRGSQEKVLLRCPTCGCEWAATIYRATNGRTKCPTCFPKKTRTGKPRTTSLERGAQLASRISAASNGIIEIDPAEYKNIRVKVEAHCLECDHRWEIRGDHLLEKPVCPRCKRGGIS